MIETLKRYRLTLRHGPNPDVDPDGYWSPPEDPPLTILCVETRADAAFQFAAWRDRNELGGGNLYQAELSEKGKPVLQFSYNGRAWEPHQFKDWKTAKEIILS